MKLNISLLILLMAGTVQAEPTPAGTAPTYTLPNGNSFTYYYLNGDPVPSTVRIFVSPAGTSQIVTDNGTGDTVFATRAAALEALTAKPDCSGAVFGPGPAGIPAGCPGSSNTVVSNGGSGAATPVDDEVYDKTSFQLSTLLYGAAEIGAKSCTPAGAKMPGSLSSWWTAIKGYTIGENARSKLLNERVAAIQKKIQELTTTNKDSKDMQTESIALQIEMIDASIESMNGENGRIPLREKLLVAALLSVETNGKENIKTVDAYKKMVDDTFVASTKAAQAACERKKKENVCTKDAEGNETCEEKEVKDPVPGCDVALAQIPVIRSGPAQSYGDTYLIESIASTKLNNKMEDYEIEMTNMMAAIPRSSDSNYDWSSPMENGLKVMKLARKDSGTKCPAGDDTSSKEKVDKAGKGFLISLGLSEDNTKAQEAFEKVWESADNVIGQAAYRGDYFTYVGKKINVLLGMDRTKLMTLMTTKSKLESYKNNVKAALSSGANVAPKAGTASTQTGAGPSIGKNVQGEASSGGTAQAVRNFQTSVDAVVADAAKNNNGSVSLQTSAGSVTVNGGTGTAQAGKISAGSLNKWQGLSLGSSAMSQAKKTLDNIAKNDKKLSDYITTTPTESSGKGTSSGKTNKDSKSKIAKAATVLTVVNNEGSPTSLAGSVDSSFDKLDASAGSRELYKTASFGGGYSSGRSSDGSYSSGSSGSGIKSSAAAAAPITYTKPTIATPAAVRAATLKGAAKKSVSGISPDESRLITQSIIAKRFKKKDTYETSESDSLFQRVTKAYIRNYEKVEEPAEVVEP